MVAVAVVVLGGWLTDAMSWRWVFLIKRLVETRARTMGYLDIFWMMGVVALCVCPAVLLLPQLPKGATARH